MADMGQAAFALGLVVLVVALFIPTLVGTSLEDARTTLNLSEDESTELTDKLRVEVTNATTSPSVPATPSNATIEYTDLGNLDTNSSVMDQGTNTTLNLSGDSIDTGMEFVTNDSARFNVTHPPMFGWNDSARSFIGFMDTLLVLLGGMLLIGGAWSAL